MKTLLLINYTLNYGGAERYITGLANYIVKNGYKVTIILLDRSPVQYSLNGSIKVIQPDYRRPDGRTSKILYFIRVFFYLKKWIKVIEPDNIINCAFPTFVLAAVGVRRHVNISIRCNPSNTSMIEGLNMPLFIRRFFYKRAENIIAQTNYASEFMKSQFMKSQICIIPNFLSPFTYSDMKREKIVLYVGRLIKSKGVNILLESFSCIDNEEWSLIIIGEGPERKNLEDLATKFDYNKRIRFLGNQRDVNHYYQTSEIFAFPSFTEGFPNVLLEAMAAPMACISFNCIAGPDDIITNGVDGILVETGDKVSFTRALELLMSDDKMRESFRRNAIAVRSRFSIDTIGARYLSLLTE